MRYLVDSDWVADYLNGEPDAIAHLTSLAPSGLAISLMTYGEIYEGVLFGDPDILIAATALEHDLELVTRNVGHFSRIDGLRVFSNR